MKWHEIGQAENAAIAGWTRAVPWALEREEDEISKRCRRRCLEGHGIFIPAVYVHFRNGADKRRILQALADTEKPLSQRPIRERAATRPATVAETLQSLVREGRVEPTPQGGYRIAAAPADPNAKHRQGPLPNTVTASNP